MLKTLFGLLILFSSYSFAYHYQEFAQTNFPDYYQNKVLPYEHYLLGPTVEQKIKCTQLQSEVSTATGNHPDLVEMATTQCLKKAAQQNENFFKTLIGVPTNYQKEICKELQRAVQNAFGKESSMPEEAKLDCLQKAQIKNINDLK